MVLLFKGIAPPSQFPGTVANGAAPWPNHAWFQDRVDDACFEALWRRGGGDCNTRTTFFFFPNKGDKFKSGYITPAFLGPQKCAEMLHNPCTT